MNSSTRRNGKSESRLLQIQVPEVKEPTGYITHGIKAEGLESQAERQNPQRVYRADG